MTEFRMDDEHDNDGKFLIYKDGSFWDGAKYGPLKFAALWVNKADAPTDKGQIFNVNQAHTRVIVDMQNRQAEEIKKRSKSNG